MWILQNPNHLEFAKSKYLGFCEIQYTWILQHQKWILQNPKYLGYRKVLSNDTFDLIKNANLVIGRNSASFSMAVLMNKPIATIYNSELKENAIDFKSITNFANEMGVYSINIDSEYPFTETDKLLKINQNKYKEFTKNFLTSRDDEMPNYKVILSEVFEIIL